MGRTLRYRQSFEAPDAHILVVDDNDMNLMVVTKLLAETKIQIDSIHAVYADLTAHQFHQLMHDAQPQPGALLSVRCERQAVNRVRVWYSVEDTGQGVKKENIPYIFNAFREKSAPVS